ncbi:hypothetical protein [Mucilaginibacter psychrotolerans]|uniref:Uncharacterized protein n=1 Tax=Mucilaginibacter psychrotolerans TaxID=1524096 RepID=A0A4Y8SKA2_9SPHI|nr:hypothetical protein [Mucilaginibacter psychrotolerans]TFF39308.1 hypothetical protein E2R66_06720 [Mucilaginibacter psychrotolerans]
MKAISLTLFLLCCVTICKAQSAPATDKNAYCSIDNAAALKLIGKHAKISAEGGVYSTLNDSESLKWPSPEIKALSGRSGWKKYKPAKGDVGTIVHVFIDNVSTSKYIYLLQIKGIYVPVACGYIALTE